MNEIQIFKCKRCGHNWASKQEKPTICPKCKSPYWDKEKREKSEKQDERN